MTNAIKPPAQSAHRNAAIRPPPMAKRKPAFDDACRRGIRSSLGDTQGEPHDEDRQKSVDHPHAHRRQGPDGDINREHSPCAEGVAQPTRGNLTQAVCEEEREKGASQLLLVQMEFKLQGVGQRAERVAVQIQEHRHRDAQDQGEKPNFGGRGRGGRRFQRRHRLTLAGTWTPGTQRKAPDARRYRRAHAAASAIQGISIPRR